MEKLLTENSAAECKRSRTAIIIFDTRYGNTEKIARALESGLKEAGTQTTCMNAREVNPQDLKEFDLIAVGAPTEWRSASESMKAFLGGLKNVNLVGKLGFAFDTKLSRPLSGNAAKLIERELKNRGLAIIADRESATVFLENGSTSGAWLQEGEERKFEQVGLELGNTLLRTKVVAIQS